MNLTIGKKLIGSFLIVAVLLAGVSSISYYYLKQIDSSYSDLVDRRSVILANYQRIQIEAAKQSNSLRGYVLTGEPEFLDTLQKYHGNLHNIINETTPLVYRQEDKDQLAKLDELNRQFEERYTPLLQMVQNHHDSAEMIDYYKREVLAIGRQFDPIADQMAGEQQAFMTENSNINTKMVEGAIRNVFWLSIIAVLLAVVIAFVVSRLISKPIVLMAKASQQIAAGDLTGEDIRTKNKDEIGILAQSFNQMAGNLRSLIYQVSQSAEHVAASAEELTASAEQTSQASELITATIQEVVGSAERQAQGVGESVKAMNEMSSGAQQIAANAQSTSVLSVQAAQKALEGNETLTMTAGQMDSISATMNQLADAVMEMGEHSKEIEQIVDVISDIAAQTNLLALNAAIEAARAGEHGRGFAVVADEVRKLAEQSAESARKITQLIVTIQGNTQKAVGSMEAGTREVGEGIRVVRTAGKRFEEIRNAVEEVATQTQEVSAAVQQMSAGTEQVQSSIDHISAGSKTVAELSQSVSAAAEEQLAAVEEVSSSASSLAKMAEELKLLIGKFKV